MNRRSNRIVINMEEGWLVISARHVAEIAMLLFLQNLTVNYLVIINNEKIDFVFWQQRIEWLFNNNL